MCYIFSTCVYLDVFQEAQRLKDYQHLVLPVVDSAALTGTFNMFDIFTLYEGVNDVCTLADTNEAAILNTIRVRYLKDSIYTNIGKILISMNPFHSIEG